MIETEVKFLVEKPNAVIQRLDSVGAVLTHPEVFETNLRFDTPEGKLSSAFHILRLRKDSRARLTFKGRAFQTGDVSARQEIEFEVSDFDAAQAFLEALGYEICMVYEKYRSTYELGEMEIVVDRTPLGCFVEIEGPDGPSIRKAADQLALDWDTRSAVSYAVLFERVRIALGLSLRDMTFSNFKSITVNADDLQLRPADMFFNG